MPSSRDGEGLLTGETKQTVALGRMVCERSNGGGGGLHSGLPRGVGLRSWPPAGRPAAHLSRDPAFGPGWLPMRADRGPEKESFRLHILPHKIPDAPPPPRSRRRTRPTASTNAAATESPPPPEDAPPHNKGRPRNSRDAVRSGPASVGSWRDRGKAKRTRKNGTRTARFATPARGGAGTRPVAAIMASIPLPGRPVVVVTERGTMRSSRSCAARPRAPPGPTPFDAQRRP